MKSSSWVSKPHSSTQQTHAQWLLLDSTERTLPCPQKDLPDSYDLKGNMAPTWGVVLGFPVRCHLAHVLKNPSRYHSNSTMMFTSRVGGQQVCSACMHAHTHTCTCIAAHTRHTNAYTHVYTQLWHAYTHTHSHTGIHCIHVCSQAHTHTHTHRPAFCNYSIKEKMTVTCKPYKWKWRNIKMRYPFGAYQIGNKKLENTFNVGINGYNLLKDNLVTFLITNWNVPIL